VTTLTMIMRKHKKSFSCQSRCQKVTISSWMLTKTMGNKYQGSENNLVQIWDSMPLDNPFLFPPLPLFFKLLSLLVSLSLWTK
jgi:hypothetical protein